MGALCLIQEQGPVNDLVLGEAIKWRTRGLLEGFRGLYRRALKISNAGIDHGRLEKMPGRIGNI